MITVSVRIAALHWTRPKRNVDGSALVDLAGYKVYWGPASREYTFIANVKGARSTAHTVTLAAGTWFFAVTAINSRGEESAKTNEVSKIVY
jgi:hypothetical protein